MMLREYKAKCWFQMYNSKQEYVEEIIRGIENSRVFVIFVSQHSALSNNVLNEIHYALDWADTHEEYQVLPVVISEDGFDLSDSMYRKMRFYLSRFNMLVLDPAEEKKDIVMQIFEQTGFEMAEDTLKESFYHTSDIEAQRLQSQNEILKKASNDIFETLVSERSVILDVGCARGDNIMLRLEGIPYRRLLGVDIDPQQIERAKASYGSEKNDFQVCDITADAFYDLLQEYLDSIDVSGFDLIHVSAVLLHQTEPVKILKTLKRYLKSTGHLFIQEEDDGANLVHPHSSFFDNAFDIWLDSKESGDRYCARKIPAYLKDAGFKTVSLKRCGISNIDLTPEEQDPFWDIYFNYHLWEALEEDLFYNFSATKKRIDEYIAQYDTRHEEYLAGNIFIQLGFLFFVAKK